MILKQRNVISKRIIQQLAGTSSSTRHPTRWQHMPATAIHQACQDEVGATLDLPGPGRFDILSQPQNQFPYGDIYPCHHFRALFLRCLRLPLALSHSNCRCHCALATCAQAGVLRGRGIPLERAMARTSQKKGLLQFVWPKPWLDVGWHAV